MRCAACDYDSKKKDRNVVEICPNCGHQFALDPKIHGVTDGFMKRAVVAVSSNGAFKYLPAQLDYEVWRRSRPPTFRQLLSNYKFVLATLVTGLTIIAYMAFSGSAVGMDNVLVGIITLFVAAKFSRSAAAASRRPKNPGAALRRYEAVNPPTNKLGPDHFRADHRREIEFMESPVGLSGEAESPEPPADVPAGTELLEIETDSAPMVHSLHMPFDRLLVCERPEYRDFYIANEFHLHHACYVIGFDDLETEDGRALLDQLKQKPELDVFVVHDATPRGVKFVDEVKSDRRWFGGHAAAAVLDLGLIPDQLPMFETMLRPLTPEEMEGVDQAATGLPEKMGADLSVIPAAPLMSLTGASVDERLTFDKNSYAEIRREGKRDESEEGWWYLGVGDGE